MAAGIGRRFLPSVAVLPVSLEAHRVFLCRRLSYANVVASLALFVALGGTGYAALTITGSNVKDGSLAGRDIRNGSVASADIKDRSLLAKDFKARQLAAGAPGAPGASGAPGAPGAAGQKGDKGDAGEAGAARAYAFVNSDGSVDETRSKGVADTNVTATTEHLLLHRARLHAEERRGPPRWRPSRTSMVEMGVCQFNVVLNTGGGFMLSSADSSLLSISDQPTASRARSTHQTRTTGSGHGGPTRYPRLE